MDGGLESVRPEEADERRQLEAWLLDARDRSRALVLDLHPDAWQVPRREILTPMLWELAHVTWFHERFTLREGLGHAPMHKGIDELYDSSQVEHNSRWDLEAFSLDAVLAWDNEVRTRQLEALANAAPQFRDLLRLAIFHEDMHAEAFAMMRQELSYPPPATPLPLDGPTREVGGKVRGVDGDLSFASCRMPVGCESYDSFDNERGGVPIEVPAFSIARRCVSELEFMAFVEDDAYARREFWSEAGWTWLQRARVVAPGSWSRIDGAWHVREFDKYRDARPELPVMHVSKFECEAWCRWAGRRLPTEFEWERAACGVTPRRRFPWGDRVQDGCANVGLRIHADRALVAEQVEAAISPDEAQAVHMIGNVWEWTSSSFLPYPGFRPGVYANYSAPFWRTRSVLRGGSWATTARMLRGTMRNFFEPWRRDLFAGFRSCALERPG